MFGRKAIKVAGNRFLALMLFAAMAAGLVVPAGGKVSAAGPIAEIISTTPPNGEMVSQLNGLKLLASAPVGNPLVSATYQIQRARDGKYMDASQNPVWVTPPLSGIRFMDDLEIDKGIFIADFDREQLNALSEDGFYYIYYRVSYLDGYMLNQISRILLDRAPHIKDPVIHNDAIGFGFTEGLVVEPLFNFQNSHFMVTVNGAPADILFVAPSQANDNVLILLKNRVVNTDVVKIRFDPGGTTPVKNQAGYPLGTEEIELTNTSTGLFQAPPAVRWPNKTGYELKAGDPIVTFTPSRSGANNIEIAFPKDSGNTTTLSNGNIVAADFKIRSGAGSIQPRVVVPTANHLYLYLPVGEALTGGTSYTLEMSDTAEGNEIKLPPIETTASTAYLAARIDAIVDDEYTFSNLAFYNNLPPVAKSGLSVTLEVGGDRAYYSAEDLATDLDEDDMTLSGATSSDNSVAEATVDVDRLLRIDPVSPGNATVTVEVEDGNSHRVTATIAVTVTRPRTSALLPEDVQVKNQASGADSVTIQGVPLLAVVNVYDVPTGGNRIGTATQGAATGSLVVTIAAGIPGSKIYVTVQDITANLLESARTEVDVPAFVDKSLLESWIDSAREKVNNAVEGQSIGEYEIGSKADLQNAINIAVAVRDNPDATQAEVNPLISMMIDAVNVFDSRKIVADMSALIAKVGEAMAKYMSSSEGNLIGQYEAGAMATLQAAAFSAFQVSIKVNVTQQEVDAATVTLTAAIAEFDGKKIGAALAALLVSAQGKHDAATVGGANGQYPTGAKEVLQDAIDEAWAVADDIAATKVQVDAAVVALNAAVVEFEAKVISGVVVVDKGTLTNAISAAQATYGAAVEGTGNGQYPVGSRTILNVAITAAKTVANNASATQAQVDVAVVALNAAVTAFEAKKIVIQPSGGGGGGSSSQQITVQLSVESGGVVLGTLPLSRTIDLNGRATDKLEIKKDATSQWVERLKGTGELRLIIPDDKDIEDELNVMIPLDVVTMLAANNLELIIVTNSVEVRMPASSLKGFKEAITLKITPIRAKLKQDEIKRRADGNTKLRDEAGKGALKPIGLPVAIETNFQNRKVMLTLPIGSDKLSEQKLGDTGIYVEHSDGTQEWLLPSQTAKGLTFEVNKFSTFAIVQVEGWRELRIAKAKKNITLPYIKGYASGVFKPEASITRAELAAILAKVIQREPTQTAITFKDVAATSWASEAIDKVVKLGLMKGSPNGDFMPNKPITRAEIAVIAAVIYEGGARNASESFTDIAGHWANTAIVEVSAAGILTGFKDGTFRPSQALSRAEAVVLINRLIGLEQTAGGEPLYKDVPATHWAYGAIQAAAHSSKP
ncbi:S-layer homology domain-containing protein [Cohnella mopanensis]|uniref:S-layer homology domain-containing protein n=1 Tax=Cohnella mopanensis TaxID=2911966 RepID=UPI001EF7D9E7|nr:S-layer homology domain-containing protein [Cohnella mopanensis]